MNGDDGVQAVGLAGEQGGELEAVDLRPEGIELGTDFGADVLALAAQVEVGVEVAELGGERVVGLDLLLQPLALGEDRLGGFVVLPEIRLGYLLLNLVKLMAACGGVKENSAARRCAF